VFFLNKYKSESKIQALTLVEVNETQKTKRAYFCSGLFLEPARRPNCNVVSPFESHLRFRLQVKKRTKSGRPLRKKQSQSLEVIGQSRYFYTEGK
jgi:hypothetical protein